MMWFEYTEIRDLDDAEDELQYSGVGEIDTENDRHQRSI